MWPSMRASTTPPSWRAATRMGSRCSSPMTGWAPGPTSDGFGVSRSIRERMDAVGGSALIGPGPQGRGTVVLLEWHPAPAPAQQIGSDLLLRTAGIVLMIATFLAGVASALVVLGWSAYAVPWLALAGGLRPRPGRGRGSSGEAREGRRIGTSHVIAACATYVLVGAVALLADPYCSSLLGEGVLLDARVPMMAMLLLLAPRPGVLGAIVATVGLAHLGGALAWNAALVAVRSGHRHGGGLRGGRPRGRLAVRRAHRPGQRAAGRCRGTRPSRPRCGMGTELSIRAEEELWVADTLASAQELLDDIATGRRDPGRPADPVRLRRPGGVPASPAGRGTGPHDRAPAGPDLAAAAACRGLPDQGPRILRGLPGAPLGSSARSAASSTSCAPWPPGRRSPSRPGRTPTRRSCCRWPGRRVGRAGPALVDRIDRVIRRRRGVT